MAVIHPGATLTPHFRDFLPGWVARQPWYRGTGVPVLSPVGFFRFEDPEGEVGVETHLVTDGAAVYQIPMTYRGRPVDGGALIATAEHSVLGTRWIYDGETDPVWRAELVRLVRTNGVTDPSGRRGAGPAEARGRLLVPEAPDTTTIELTRVLAPGEPDDQAGVAGLVVGTWHQDGAPVTGCLAVLRDR